jgi:CheY-like chemotaxis protein
VALLASDTLDVLVVDDSDFFVSVTADKLGEEHGIATRTANSGAEALSILEDESVDCVVSDYQMPATNGLELYRGSRTGTASPSMVTGEGDEMVASHAMSVASTSRSGKTRSPRRTDWNRSQTESKTSSHSSGPATGTRCSSTTRPTRSSSTTARP